nr:hypothetical protein [Acidimicrobiia bacterium]
SFSNPNFYSPGSVADWFAVASVSIALGLLPVGVWILLQRSNLGPLPVRSLSLASMVTAGTAAVANVVEDGFGVSVAGTAFFVGIVGTLLVLSVAAAGLAVRGPRVLALVPLATVIGMVNLERAGGLLVLIAWGCLALSLPSAPKMAAQKIQRSPEQS